MLPPPSHSWINLAELKGQLIRKLGPERSKQYFDYLNRFLSLKISKVEFDKVCLRTVGRENLSLHNQLIRSILKNAFTRKVPPVGHKKSVDGAYRQNGSVPNRDVLPPSPWKERTGAREQRVGDRRSTLVPNGKTNYASPSSQSGDFSITLENDNASRKLLSQQRQELTRQAENGHVKEISGRGSLHAPLGVPHCPGGARRAPSLVSSSKCVSVLDAGGLTETITLRERMEQIAVTKGLQGASVDCANVLNKGLDAYLKGLICSFSDLKTRSGHEARKNISVKHWTQAPGHRYQIQSSGWPLDAMQEHEPKRTLSLLDFRVAMELNPRQLGEEWPMMMEKICTHSFEE